MLWSRLKAFFGFDTVVSGTVTATHHYPAGLPESDTVKVGTGKAQFFVEAPMPVSSESWSLTVEGIDKHGSKVTEEIYAPWDVWSNAKIGDRYP